MGEACTSDIHQYRHRHSQRGCVLVDVLVLLIILIVIVVIVIVLPRNSVVAAACFGSGAAGSVRGAWQA
jgi:hypothetical protein